ncbi:hypothetical protein BE221DRAFT_112103 [Ostreococcus tauri]|uniref:Uncharacterized protein n=1 Tax=Ostreococcus tauri TaxID=70448 RepID=A0A1Y5IB16_OSTTA|nr:hypothetical protein BE221DRAFT_112103 [Ostreococcus tauri]
MSPSKIHTVGKPSLNPLPRSASVQSVRSMSQCTATRLSHSVNSASPIISLLRSSTLSTSTSNTVVFVLASALGASSRHARVSYPAPSKTTCRAASPPRARSIVAKYSTAASSKNFVRMATRPSSPRPPLALDLAPVRPAVDVDGLSSPSPGARDRRSRTRVIASVPASASANGSRINPFAPRACSSARSAAIDDATDAWSLRGRRRASVEGDRGRRRRRR